MNLPEPSGCLYLIVLSFHSNAGTKIKNYRMDMNDVSQRMDKTLRCYTVITGEPVFVCEGATGIILGNSSIDLILHDTYYIIAHFHFILSLGAIISILSSISFNHNYIFINKNLLFSNGSLLSIYLLSILFFGIILLFSPMHLLGFNVIPRRIPDYPDSFHSWNFLSSIGSGITLLSFSFLYILKGISYRGNHF